MEIVDIKASVSSRSLIKDEFFRNADFLKDSRGRLISYVGGYSVVFPAIIAGKKWAFRCWHVDPGATARKFQIISEQIKSAKLPYFTQFDYVGQGISVKSNIYPTIRMKWVEGVNLKKYILSHEHDTDVLNDLAYKFLEMVRTLHENYIAHGDLQHENILVKDTGQLVLIDYDSMYLPALKGIADNDIIAGKPDYQHPDRRFNKVASEKLDYFSELVIFMSILGIIKDRSLIKKYQVADSEGLLFSFPDYKDIRHSRIYSDLFNLGSPFPELLGVLEEYLKQNDINLIKPFEEYFNFDWKRYLITEAEDNEANRYIAEFELWNHACKKNTIKAYNGYISAYPGGKHIPDARKRITDLRDDNCWSVAARENTIEGYKKYLSLYPNGRHKAEASRAIDEHAKIKKARVSSVIIGVAIISVIFLLFFGIRNVGNKGIGLPIPLEKSVIHKTKEIPAIERETEKLIKSMEVAKFKNDPINGPMKEKVKDNLQSLKQANSPKYDRLKQRYDRL